MVKFDPHVTVEEQVYILAGLVDALVELCPSEEGAPYSSYAAVMHHVRISTHELRRLIHEANDCNSIERQAQDRNSIIPFEATSAPGRMHSDQGMEAIAPNVNI